MNLKLIGWLGLAVAFVVWCALPVAADQGVPSQATLHAMGLANAQIVSDDQALTVRGLGYGGKGGAKMHFASLAGKHDGNREKFDKGRYDGPDVGEGHKGPALKKHHHGGKPGFPDGKLGCGDCRHGFGGGKLGCVDCWLGFGDGKHGFADGKHGFGDGQLGFGGGKHGCCGPVMTVAFHH